MDTAIMLFLDDQAPELAKAHDELYPERIELRDAGAVAERGLARVAATRVDPSQADRLVALPGHVSRNPNRARAITIRWISLVPS